MLALQSLLGCFEFNLVNFVEVCGSFDVGPVLGNSAFQLGFSVDEPVMLVGQVGREFSPSSGLLGFSFLQDALGFRELLPQLDQ